MNDEFGMRNEFPRGGRLFVIRHCSALGGFFFLASQMALPWLAGALRVGGAHRDVRSRMDLLGAVVVRMGRGRRVGVGVRATGHGDGHGKRQEMGDRDFHKRCFARGETGGCQVGHWTWGNAKG